MFARVYSQLRPSNSVKANEEATEKLQRDDRELRAKMAELKEVNLFEQIEIHDILPQQLKTQPDLWFDNPKGYLKKPRYSRPAQEIVVINKKTKYFLDSKYQTRWFVLMSSKHRLTYYKDQNESEGKNYIDLTGIVDVQLSQVFDAPEHSLDLVSKDKHYTIVADSQVSMVRWALAISEALLLTLSDAVHQHMKPNAEENHQLSTTVALSTANSRKTTRTFAPDDLSLSWSEIDCRAVSVSAAILGRGGFGTVIRAWWSPLDGEAAEDVAVKLISRILSGAQSDEEFYTICQRVCEEAQLVYNTERLIGSSQHMTKIYGVAEGPLPDSMIQMFRLRPEDEFVGIVMRLEFGGSLETLLYKKKHVVLSMADKIRLLASVAKGLSEIHAVGVVHGDIKPDNILLSADEPPEVRLADFGMARVTQTHYLGESTLCQTRRLRGTPIYCAPEMLVNPFENEVIIAQASRKTDIYAFAFLCWTVLTRTRPLSEITSEAALSTKVHLGLRPNLTVIPADTPPSVRSLMEACWDKNRSLRRSAAECFSILHAAHRSLTSSKDFPFLSVDLSEEMEAQRASIFARYDAYIMKSSHEALARCIGAQLAQRGFSHWRNCSEDSDDLDGNLSNAELDRLIYLASMNPYTRKTSALPRHNRRAVIVIINSVSQYGHQMAELKLVVDSPLIVPVIVIVQTDFESWMNRDLREICNLSATIIVDLSPDIPPAEEEEDLDTVDLEALSAGLFDDLDISSPAYSPASATPEQRSRATMIERSDSISCALRRLADKLEFTGCSRTLDSFTD